MSESNDIKEDSEDLYHTRYVESESDIEQELLGSIEEPTTFGMARENMFERLAQSAGITEPGGITMPHRHVFIPDMMVSTDIIVPDILTHIRELRNNYATLARNGPLDGNEENGEYNPDFALQKVNMLMTDEKYIGPHCKCGMSEIDDEKSWCEPPNFDLHNHGYHVMPHSRFLRFTNCPNKIRTISWIVCNNKKWSDRMKDKNYNFLVKMKFSEEDIEKIKEYHNDEHYL